MAPVAFDALVKCLAEEKRAARYNAAMIVAAEFNAHNDWDKRPMGWEAEDFMPGDKRRRQLSDQEDMRQFAMEAELGELRPVDPQAVEQFARGFVGNVKPPEGVQRVKQ